MERWATFDCYGTLIDWDGGVRAELARVFDEERADELRRETLQLYAVALGEEHPQYVAARAGVRGCAEIDPSPM